MVLYLAHAFAIVGPLIFPNTSSAQDGGSCRVVSGVVNWWPGDGTAKDIASDQNGLLVDGTTFGRGVEDLTFAFDGQNGCVLIPWNNAFNPSQFSAEVWVNPLGPIDNPEGQVLVFGQPFGQFQLVLRTSLTGLRPVWQFVTEDGNTPGVLSAIEIPVNTFSHLVGSWDGVVQRLFVNGELAGTNVPGANPTASLLPLFIGGITNASGYSGQFFHGLVDETTLYNRALSEDEVRVMAMTSAGKCKDSLAASLVEQPNPQYAARGSLVTLHAGAIGTAPVLYQWSFNGGLLPGATNAVLELGNVQPEQQGLYSVSAQNGAGRDVSPPAAVLVLGPQDCIPPSDHATGWWPGEATGADLRGQHNAILQAGMSFAPGKVGSGFSFPGTGQRMVIPYATNLLGTAFSIECWVKAIAPAGNMESQAVLFAQPTGKAQLLLRNSSLRLKPVWQFASVDGSFSSAASSVDVGTNEFVHIAATWDEHFMQLYLNGNLVAQTASLSPPVDSAQPFYVGGFDSSQFFNGVIDELTVYNSALSIGEIQAIYAAGAQGKCKSIAAPSIIGDLPSQQLAEGSALILTARAIGTPPLTYQWQRNGLPLPAQTNATLLISAVSEGDAGEYWAVVHNLIGESRSPSAEVAVIPRRDCAGQKTPTGFWPGDNSTVDVARGSEAKLTAGASYGPGEVGPAFRFNGSNGVLVIPYSAGLLPSSFTVEAWVEPTGPITSPDGQAVLFAQPFGKAQLLVRPGTSGLIAVCQFASSDGSFTSTASPTEVPLNAFTHLAGVWDQSSLKLYANGNLVSQIAATKPPVDSGSPYYAGGFASPLSVVSGGNTGLPGPDNQVFNGFIDELATYAEALSDSEIAEIYKAGPQGKCTSYFPQATLLAEAISLESGADRTLAVSIQGTAPFTYQWQRNGSDLVGETAATLAIHSAQAEQAGDYQLVVSNAIGSSRSEPIHLTVLPANACFGTSGLVSWWSADDSPQDKVGPNDGFPSGGVTFAPGKIGDGFIFDGATGSVRIPYSPSLAPPSFSIEAWLDPVSQPGDGQALIFGQAAGIHLVVRPSNAALRAIFGVYLGNSTFIDIVSTNEIPLNRFSHLVGSWDGARVSIYVNGALSGTAVSSAPIQPSVNPFYLGGLPGTGQFFHGRIDEIGYYDHALKPAEVASLFQALSGKCELVGPTILVQPSDQVGLLGDAVEFRISASGTLLQYQWRFNEVDLPGATNSTLHLPQLQAEASGHYDVVVSNSAGLTLSSTATLQVVPSDQCAPNKDVVAWWPGDGNSRDIAGSLDGIPQNTVGYAAGLVGQAFLFDGSSNAILIPFRADLFSASYSIESWIKPMAAVQNQVLETIVFGQPYGGPDLALRPGPQGGSTVTWQFLAADGTWAGVTSSQEIPLGQYSHLVGTWDGADLKLFINGVLAEQTTSGKRPVLLAQPYFIGGFATTDGAGQFFNGQIDEVTIFHQALAATDISRIYRLGQIGKCKQPIAPTILSEPIDQDIQQGLTTVLQIFASGTQPLNYQWFYNGRALPGATDASLTLTNLQESAAGLYWVEVTNSSGAVQSRLAKITVAVPDRTPPQITILSPAPGPTPNEVTVLSGTVADSGGVQALTWERDGKSMGALVLSTNGSDFHTGTLVLNRGDNHFRIIAQDRAGNSTSAEVITTWSPLRTLMLTSDISGREGQRVDVPITLLSPGDVGGMAFRVIYNTDYLRLMEFSWAAEIGASFTQTNSSLPGQLECSFILPGTSVLSGTQQIASISFRTRSVAADLDTPLALRVENVADSSGNVLNFGTDALTGSVHIQRRQFLGDNNGNDRLDIGDAAVVLQYITHLEPVRAWDTLLNDLNANQILDPGDVVKILRAVVGLDPQPTSTNSNIGIQFRSGSHAVIAPPPVPPNPAMTLAADHTRISAGQDVTIQIQAHHLSTPISGASFDLNYPTNALRLVSAQSLQLGPIVAPNPVALWNVAPKQNNYDSQSGRVSLAVTTATTWRTNDNAIALLTFQVQPGARSQSRWPVTLTSTEVTLDGFDNIQFPSIELDLTTTDPVPVVLETELKFVENKTQLVAEGDSGYSYSLEASENLTDWVIVETINSSTGRLLFTDSASIGRQKFYRVRLVEP